MTPTKITSKVIADDAIDSEHYTDGSIDTAHIAADAVTGAKIADDAIDSEHYAAGSIDNEHLADDAVGVAELSATGTASSSTFLRGDNAWSVVSGGTSWQSVQTSSFTAVAGKGYPCNTTSSAFTVTLPAGSAGDTIELIDYAGTFDSNKLTITANGSEKILASTNDVQLGIEKEGSRLVYVDSTQGWAPLAIKPASISNISGGTMTAYSGYIVHTFTSSANLVITGSDKTCSILIVAGGGSGCGGTGGGGGGGAVIYRDSVVIPVGTNTISIGAGGVASSSVGPPGTAGSDTVFTPYGGSAVTAKGGGSGRGESAGGTNGANSGGGTEQYAPETPPSHAAFSGYTVYAENTGGTEGGGGSAWDITGGGAGAGADGGDGTSTTGGAGGAGVQVGTIYNGSTNHYWAGGGGGSASYAHTAGAGGLGGGGGGSASTSGTQGAGGGSAFNSGAAGTVDAQAPYAGAGGDGGANTGAGGGAAYDGNGLGGNGGSGIVIVRYAV